MPRDREEDDDPDNHQASPQRRRLDDDHSDGEEQGPQMYRRGHRARRRTFTLGSQKKRTVTKSNSN